MRNDLPVTGLVEGEIMIIDGLPGVYAEHLHPGPVVAGQTSPHSAVAAFLLLLPYPLPVLPVPVIVRLPVVRAVILVGLVKIFTV